MKGSQSVVAWNYAAPKGAKGHGALRFLMKRAGSVVELPAIGPEAEEKFGARKVLMWPSSPMLFSWTKPAAMMQSGRPRRALGLTEQHCHQIIARGWGNWRSTGR